jgi:hypothetical protein
LGGFWPFLGGFPGSNPAKGVQKMGVFGVFLGPFWGFLDPFWGFFGHFGGFFDLSRPISALSRKGAGGSKHSKL